MSVQLSENAVKHIKGSLAKRGKGVGIRLAVKTSGCSGLAYKLEFVDHIGENDVTFETDGLAVIVDQKSLPYLDGTVLDYTREGVNEGFRFNNPNAKAHCGCGESFTV